MVSELIKTHRPQVVCLVETKIKDLSKQTLRQIRGSDGLQWVIKEGTCALGELC